MSWERGTSCKCTCATPTPVSASSIDRPLTASLLDHLLALLVEVGIDRVGIVLEALGIGGVEHGEGGSLRDDLHAHDRGRRTQVDEVDIASESHRQAFLQIEALDWIDLLLRSLLAIGVTRRELARIVDTPKTKRAA